MRGATGGCIFILRTSRYFNPRAPCGARRACRTSACGTARFQSTRPVRGATRAGRRGYAPGRDFNPRAPCGARLYKTAAFVWIKKFQSTRPVRGATLCLHGPPPPENHFNPRAPCGARLHRRADPALYGRFQSTRPVRGATSAEGKSEETDRISIHAPRAGRDRKGPIPGHSAEISIHAPRAGRDQVPGGSVRPRLEFQSTRPVRGATLAVVDPPYGIKISIHAPRAGRDFHAVAHALPLGISIHAPRAGRDRQNKTEQGGRPYFNPRAPCGARHAGMTA